MASFEPGRPKNSEAQKIKTLFPTAYCSDMTSNRRQPCQQT